MNRSIYSLGVVRHKALTNFDLQHNRCYTFRTMVLYPSKYKKNLFCHSAVIVHKTYFEIWPL